MLMISDFEWIRNKELKLGQVSNFYLEECDNNISKNDVKKTGSLIPFINSPNSDIPLEIPCYRELRTEKSKNKKRRKHVQIKLNNIESDMSEDGLKLIGCVNPGLYINILEEEVPIIMKAQKSKVNKGYVDNAMYVQPKINNPKRKHNTNNEYEEFNIYKEQFNSQIEEKKPKKKKMRPSRSQNALVINPVPFELVVEEEKKKRKSGLYAGLYDDFEIDPFGNDNFVAVPDYTTLTKNKDKEYVDDEPQSRVINSFKF